MNKSEQINELALALSKAQSEFTSAKMDSNNPFFKSKYADLGSVIEAAKPACAKYGLSVTQPVSCDGRELTVTTILMHQSGQWIESTFTMAMSDSKGSSPAQAAGSLITYLRRYSLAAILGIYSDEDQDGNDSKPAAKPAQVQPAAPAQPANGNGKPTAREFTPLEAAKHFVVPGGSKKGAALDTLLTDELEKLIIWASTKTDQVELFEACELLVHHRKNGVTA